MVIALVLGGSALFCLDVLRAAPGDHLARAVLVSFGSALCKFLLWALVAVAAGRLLARLPLRPRTVPLYLAASVGLAALVTVGAEGLQAGLRPALRAALPEGAAGRLVGAWTGGSSLALTLPWDLLTSWALLAALAVAHGTRRARERQRRAIALDGEVSRAHLHVLETQLHPHFLFNTLHTIAALLGPDPAAARAITRRLRDLFGRLLAARDQPVQRLDQDLALLEDYVAIQKARFGARLRLVVDVDPSCREVPVPVLLLQPLVENAVRHGAARRAGPTRIQVTARRAAEGLELAVEDDGPGCAAPTGAGIGLPHTRRRLQEMYGTRHRFLFEGRGPSGGVKVRITLPCQLPAPATTPAPLVAGPPVWAHGWLVFLAAMAILNVVWASARHYAYGRHLGVSWPGELGAGARGAAALVALYPAVHAFNRWVIAPLPAPGRIALHALAALDLSILKSSAVRLLALALGGPYADQPVAALVAHRIYADLLHYVVMAGLCHALEQRRQAREEALRQTARESELAAARLEARRRELRPAWLLATLAELEGLIGEAPAAADRLVASLGETLRAHLRQA